MKGLFSTNLKNQLILLFNSFLLLFKVLLYFLILFISSTVLFQLTFTFQQKNFNFNKISESQTKFNLKPFDSLLLPLFYATSIYISL